MASVLKYQRLTILWALFILLMCSIKLGSLGHSRFFFRGFDKMVHCGFFFVLVILYCNGLLRQQNHRFLTYKSAFGIILATVVYGGLIELLQLFVFTWRSGEWADLFSDMIGAMMAVFGVLIIGRAINDEKN